MRAAEPPEGEPAGDQLASVLQSKVEAVELLVKVALWTVVGSVPRANSCALEKPSESGSAESAAEPVLAVVPNQVRRHCSCRVVADTVSRRETSPVVFAAERRST
jgi:hypothetical protein